MCELSDCKLQSSVELLSREKRLCFSTRPILFRVLLAAGLFWPNDIASGQLAENVPQSENAAAKSHEPQEAVLLGYVRLVHGRIRTWGPEWKPADLPVPPVSELKELETAGVFRVAQNARLQVIYWRDGYGFYLSRQWRSASDPTVMYATIQVPSDRYTGTVETTVVFASGSKKTIAFTADDVGKRKYIGENDLDSLSDLQSHGDGSIEMCLMYRHKGQPPSFAEATDGTFVAGEIVEDVMTYYDGLHMARIRFRMPIEKLRGIVIVAAGIKVKKFEHSNLRLQPDIFAPLRASAETGNGPTTLQEVSDTHTVRLTLSNGAVADVVGVGRLNNGQPEWWSVDGKDRIEHLDVTVAEMDGLGIVVALKLSKYSSATPYLERDGRREYLGERSFSTSSGIILVGLDPKNEPTSENLSSENLTIVVSAAEPETLQLVEVAPKSTSIPKTDDRIISRLLKVESAGPNQCSVLFNFQSNGLLKFAGIDSSGTILIPSSGLIAAEYAKLTFPVPLEQLREIAVQHAPRAEAKIAGISLRPGTVTTPTVFVSEVTRTEEQLRQDQDRDNGSSTGMTYPGFLGVAIVGKKISGVVVDSEGKPMSDVPIFTCRDPAFSELGNKPDLKESCRSAADGKFEFRVDLSNPSRNIAAMNDDGFGWGKYEHPDTPVDIVFRPWGSVSGTLRLGDKPAANNKVMLWWFETQTNAEGKFEFP